MEFLSKYFDATKPYAFFEFYAVTTSQWMTCLWKWPMFYLSLIIFGGGTDGTR